MENRGIRGEDPQKFGPNLKNRLDPLGTGPGPLGIALSADLVSNYQFDMMRSGN